MDWKKFFFWRKSSEYEVLDRFDSRNPQDGDAIVVKKLREEGADLSQKREVLHYLYLPSVDAASRAAQELRSEGYSVEQRPSADADKNPPNPWLVLAKIVAVVNDTVVEETTLRFTELATRHGGEYDGWEAAIKP